MNPINYFYISIGCMTMIAILVVGLCALRKTRRIRPETELDADIDDMLDDDKHQCSNSNAVRIL
ncbi:hypothetical protein BDF22DRAFT_776224 [Syncephalis plumigaleata]|nr:hypothetical protein BDF22DRAFT_776224 [Syncephalis plumigaleata]